MSSSHPGNLQTLVQIQLFYYYAKLSCSPSEFIAYHIILMFFLYFIIVTSIIMKDKSEF